LLRVIKPETGEEPSGSSTCRVPSGTRRWPITESELFQTKYLTSRRTLRCSVEDPMVFEELRSGEGRCPSPDACPMTCSILILQVFRIVRFSCFGFEEVDTTSSNRRLLRQPSSLMTLSINRRGSRRTSGLPLLWAPSAPRGRPP
jgi:hypothetical protein